MNWPTGPIIKLDSANVDGMDNALIPHGADVYSWVNQGSFSTPFAQSAPSSMPLIKKGTRGAPVVAFDGRSDQLTCVASKTALAFIHATGLFDIALTLRRTGGVNNGEHRVFGAEVKGLSMLWTAYSLGAGTVDGGFKFALNNGVAPMADRALQFRAPLGEVASLFIRGTGAKVRATQDFWNWEEQTFLAAPIAGDASNDYALGMANGSSGSDYFSGYDLISLLIWDRNLNQTEQLVVKANFEEQAVLT